MYHLLKAQGKSELAKRIRDGMPSDDESDD